MTKSRSEPLLSMRTLAWQEGVHISTVRGWCRHGRRNVRLESVILNGERFVPARVFEQWIAEVSGPKRSLLHPYKQLLLEFAASEHENKGPLGAEVR